MSTLSAMARLELEKRMAELVGDEIVLRFHDGDPGPDLSDNVIAASDLVTRATFADGGTVEFRATHPATYYVSVWSRDMAINLIMLNKSRQQEGAFLAADDTVTIASFPSGRVSSQ